MKNIAVQKIRGLAIILVVILHSITLSDANNYENILLLFIRTICNLAVPTFFFFSGYYFNFNKYNNNNKYLKDKILRLLIPLIIWNIFYFVLSGKFGISSLLLFKGASHLYFLVVLIQLIWLTPLFHKFNKKLLYAITPIYLLLYRFILIKYNYSLPLHQFWIFGWLIYYLMGLEYQNKIMKSKISKFDYIKIVLLFCIVFLSNIFVYYNIGTTFAFSQMNIINMMFCIYIYQYIIIYIKYKANTKVNFLSKIGDISFGIYFIHMFCLKIASKLLALGLTNCIIITFFKSLITIFLSFWLIRLFCRLTKNKYNNFLGF